MISRPKTLVMNECSTLVLLLLLAQGGECPPRPSNDRCTNATAIGSLPFSTTADISGARNVGVGSSASSCYGIAPSVRGVWYELDGDGSCVNVALLSNFPAGVAVYAGASGCEDLTCAFLSENIQFGDSNYTFSTEAGQKYYILVGGNDNDVGFFSLGVSVSIRQGSNGSTYLLYGIMLTNWISFFSLRLQKATCAPNDQCNNATKIAELPFNARGTNAFSTPEALGSGVYSCNNVNPSVNSVWYEVQGDGSCLTASLPFSNFDPTIAVYGGSGCTDLTCLGEGQYYNGNQITWQTEVGEAYFLLVGAYGTTGDFGLEVEVRLMQCMPLPLSFCVFTQMLFVFQNRSEATAQKMTGAKMQPEFNFLLLKRQATLLQQEKATTVQH
jgi:hypothetical protein